MSDHASFLAAIRANPTDNLPRLVYADWLEENARSICIDCDGTGRVRYVWPEQACRCEQYVPDGRMARATFIRLQVELAAIPKRQEMVKPTRRLELERQIESLLADGLLEEWCRNEYGDDEGEETDGQLWTSGFYKSPQEHVAVKWDRGFISQVRCRLIDWFGDECVPCGGYGELTFGGGGTGEPIRHITCTECRGVGRVNCLGPAMVLEHSVATVSLTDREPIEGPNGNYLWAGGSANLMDEREEGAALPDELFRTLRGGSTVSGRYWMSYRSREAAITALSDALIAWALSHPTVASPRLSHSTPRTAAPTGGDEH